MAGKKYPLDPLAKLREQHVDEASRALAGAVRERESAERRQIAAEEERALAEAKALALREAERAKLEGGELKVADLMRADAWGVAVEVERKRLEAQVDRADEAVRDARAGEVGQRAVVASRQADAQVTEKDRAKWTEAERREALAREEEEAAEAWRPKRG